MVDRSRGQNDGLISDCKSSRIEFAGIPGQRIAFDVTNTTFSSHDIMLAGRLVMPQGTGRVPVVVCCMART